MTPNKKGRASRAPARTSTLISYLAQVGRSTRYPGRRDRALAVPPVRQEVQR